MGGTIRTTLNLAGSLAETHEVEILSMVRRRTRPALGFPPGVSVTAVDDQRSRPNARELAPGRLLRRLPSLLVHPADRLSRRCSLWTDLQVVREGAGWRLTSSS